MSIVNQPPARVNGQTPIRIAARLTPAQAATVRERLFAQFPALPALHAARRLQTLNVSGQFRLNPLCGAQLPAGLTADLVAAVIATVQIESTTDHDDAVHWQGRMAYQVAHSRAGRRGVR